MNTIFLIDAKAERRAEAGRVLLQGDRHLIDDGGTMGWREGEP